jgi:hypothetical protein
MPSSLDVHTRHVSVRYLLDNCTLLVVPPPIIVFFLSFFVRILTTSPPHSPNSCECVVEKHDNMLLNSRYVVRARHKCSCTQ